MVGFLGENTAPSCASRFALSLQRRPTPLLRKLSRAIASLRTKSRLSSFDPRTSEKKSEKSCVEVLTAMLNLI
jgi:hypothetical protein